jgi:hypothetical protein
LVGKAPGLICFSRHNISKRGKHTYQITTKYTNWPYVGKTNQMVVIFLPKCILHTCSIILLFLALKNLPKLGFAAVSSETGAIGREIESRQGIENQSRDYFLFVFWVKIVTFSHFIVEKIIALAPKRGKRSLGLYIWVLCLKSY